MAYRVSYFKELQKIDDLVVSQKLSAEKNYDAETFNKMLTTYRVLKEFVMEGEWVRSKHLKYIAKHYNLSSHELAIRYEADTGISKSEKTFRVQIKTMSDTLYDLLGNSVYENFFTGNVEALHELEMKISFIKNGAEFPNDLFPEEICKYLQNLPDGSNYYSVDECIEELKVLARIMTKNSIKQLEQVDKNKLKYLYAILMEDIIVKTSDGIKVNREKDKILNNMSVIEKRTTENQLRREIEELKAENFELTKKFSAYKENLKLEAKKYIAKAKAELKERYENCQYEGGE